MDIGIAFYFEDIDSPKPLQVSVFTSDYYHDMIDLFTPINE